MSCRSARLCGALGMLWVLLCGVSTGYAALPAQDAAQQLRAAEAPYAATAAQGVGRSATAARAAWAAHLRAEAATLASCAAAIFADPGSVGDATRAHLGLRTVRIASGDTLSRIAARLRIGSDLLQRMNPRADARRLQIGDELQGLDLASVPMQLRIDRQAFALSLWRGSALLGAFPCGLGRPDRPTPAGTTTIAQRVRDPEWRDPDSGRIFPPRDPGNVLGGYWLGFSPGADKRFSGIGVHGFTGADPREWLGQAGSHGCARLTQPDIALVFALCLPGTRVVVE